MRFTGSFLPKNKIKFYIPFLHSSSTRLYHHPDHSNWVKWNREWDEKWGMENGEWGMENAVWRMGNGGWRMENGDWIMENEEWRAEWRMENRT